jgi:molecular chaperone GrpE
VQEEQVREEQGAERAAGAIPEDGGPSSDNSFVTGNDESPAEAALSLEDQLAAAKALAEEYLDGWQRSRAEFANARKRMQRESAESYRNATVDVIARLLPVIDDFDRGLSSVPPAVASTSWFEGLQLVHRKLVGILEGAEIEAIPALGQPFDPNLHNAIMREASDEFESGTVIRELQTGYRLGERIIRPTLVVVAE